MLLETSQASGLVASLLPHNRGSAPINWAIINGERSTGNTLIWLAASVDEGNIIAQREFTINAYDTCASLYDRVAETNRDMLLEVVPRLLAGETPGYPQHSTNEPVLARRRPKDGLVNWAQSGGEIYNFIRALTRPYPGAFSFLEGRRWTIWDAAVLPDCSSAAPMDAGEIVGPVVSPVEKACGQVVSCGRGTVIVLSVQDDNGRLIHGRELSEQSWQGKRWANVA